MAFAIRSTTHLVMQGSTWYFRFMVPKDLQPRIGRTEIRRSLKTSYLKDAKPKAMRLASTMYLIIKDIRSGAQPMADLTDTQIQHLVDKWIRQELDRFEGFIADEPSLNEVRRKNNLTGYDVKQDDYIEQCERRNYREIASVAHGLAQDEGLEVDQNSLSFKKLCHTLLRAGIESCNIFKNRLNDDYSDPYAIVIKPAAVASVAPSTAPPGAQAETAKLSVIKTAWFAKNGHWPKTTIDQYQNYIGTFIEIVEDRPIGEITREDIRGYGDALLKLPGRRTVLKQYRELSTKQLLKMNIPNRDKLSPTTIKNSYVAVRAFLEWAEKNFNDVPPGLGGPLDSPRIDADPSKSTAAFSPEDLERIFHGPDYLNDTWKPNEAARFWLPLIMLFTGARNEEVAQLHLTDIEQQDDLWYFDINIAEGKRIKNKVSRRYVPIHDRLIDIGLLRYVDRLKGQGQTQLFPHLTRNTSRGKMADPVNKWFNRTYKSKIGLTDSQDGKKVLYSFRHTFI